jgi:hypothetical protein
MGVCNNILLTVYSLHIGSCRVTLMLDVGSYCTNVNTDVKTDCTEFITLLFVLSKLRTEVDVHNLASHYFILVWLGIQDAV